ncbi:MAG TPA: sigma-70 family RNA polymerase sigma factor [Phycisphaerae bacterium]|nr:sigma-70 family RNA polymerase sigma factor [Phycisphaerae bacterium]
MSETQSNIKEQPLEKHKASHDFADEAAIIRRCCEGESAAFEVLVRRYQDRIFRMAFGLLGSYADAEEVTQEVFLKAFEKLGTFRQKSSFYTWLFRIATNEALTHRRQKKRVSFFSIFAGKDDDPPGDLPNKKQPQPDRPMIENENIIAVRNALSKLDMDFRTVVVMRDMENMNYNEISQVLGIPVGTVKSRISRARLMLRNLLVDVVRNDS